MSSAIMNADEILNTSSASATLVSADVRILDPHIKEHIDTFRVLMLHDVKYTIFPELIEIFGTDSVIKFMDIFGGTTIKVPDRHFLQSTARDIDIYLRLSKRDEPDVTADLAVEYGMKMEYVRDIYLHVKWVRKQFGLAG